MNKTATVTVHYAQIHWEVEVDHVYAPCLHAGEGCEEPRDGTGDFSSPKERGSLPQLVAQPTTKGTHHAVLQGAENANQHV
jgi:hypothetical protein